MPKEKNTLASQDTNPVEGPLATSAIQADTQRMLDSTNEYKAEVIPENIDPDTQPELNTLNNRLLNSQFIINELASFANAESEKKKAFRYIFNNVAVGLMLVEDTRNSLHISYIVTDALSTGAGGALMEAAVRYSQSIGKLGIITLSAISPDAEAAYIRLGFLKDNPAIPAGIGSLTLNPTTSDKWSTEDGEWTISKRATQNYATGFQN